MVCSKEAWAMSFGTAIDHLRRERNNMKFEDRARLARYIVAVVVEDVRRNRHSSMGEVRMVTDVLVCRCLGIPIQAAANRRILEVFRCKPPINWVKLNFDGSSLGNPDRAGKIPVGLFTSLSKLEMVSINFNGSIGEIPTSFGNISSIRSVSLSGNGLQGSIPETFGWLANLYFLGLALNKLSGENQISGTIPAGIENLVNLTDLGLEVNFLKEIGNLKSVSTIDVSENRLFGEIPSSFGDCNSLEHLNIGHNFFEGTITQSLTLLKGLRDLDLSSNNLSREIPKDLEKFVALQSLNLSFNNLNGEIKKQHPSTPVIGDQFLKLSYKELFQATRGFFSANFVGSGSFGSLYKGIINNDETIVAIKVFNLQNPRAYKSFTVECEALQNIRHRNLVKILTLCSSLDSKGKYFKALVYEFMPNGSLDDWLHPLMEEHNHSRNLSLLQRLNIAIDVASTLDYLHYHCYTSIVHCDLKPSNVLLDSDMIAHVSDFGLARLLLESGDNSSQAQTSTIGIKGFIGYATPEYGMGGRANIKADVFSYGILLLEMFIGKRPTDQLFTNDLNLHNFAKAALLVHLMKILDPRLLPKEEQSEEIEKDDINKTIGLSHRTGKLQDCIMAIMEIALQCSKESPRERMNMNDLLNAHGKLQEKKVLDHTAKIYPQLEQFRQY
ncbi:probable LRR receptor-like serine/threonine-protein kinase At3g47570 [Macadamia integrifolia]|uniref:probable LRR receptor-like serine/threonine-protein kinase At3g47570 n=1 Tax=Macadamia integrifolia TaxID=60698 RepID=UPI001C4F9B86|nr:probable LRR receptor-like serine/threonine-protein kinase At3g47570 [Macadamia integrifolia]